MGLARHTKCAGHALVAGAIGRSIPQTAFTEDVPGARLDSKHALDHRTFDRVVRHLMTLCPIDDQDDVYRHVRRRGLQTAFARDFALPSPAQQAPLIAELVKEHGVPALATTGLLRRGAAIREPMLNRFVWPRHRWCVPWVGPDALIHSLSRAICAPCGPDIPRWVVPAGHPPLWPLGIDDVASSRGVAAQDLVVVEGPADFIAMRMLCLKRWRESREAVPLVVALHSASGIMPGWLHRYARGRRIIIATGADAVGEDLASKLTDVLRLVGSSSIERWLPPASSADWASALKQEVAA
jgi:hypothetical protein